MGALKMNNYQASNYKDSLDTYWGEIKAIQPLDRDQETRLIKQAKAGDEAALQQVIQANLRFVVKIARSLETAGGPPLIDLVSEGNIGMIEAIHRFDEARGFKFITYAVWWIRQAIFKALGSQSRAIRPPLNQLGDLIKLEKKALILSQELGRTPTLEEVALKAELSLERASNAMETSRGDVSLDEPLASDSKLSLLEVLPAQVTDEEDLGEEMTQNVLARCIKVLDKREFHIIHSYYGLGTTESQTLESIGKELGLTRERVRQLRNRGLGKMQSAYRDAGEVFHN
jgi:RNA polymerase primary sigma factor